MNVNGFCQQIDFCDPDGRMAIVARNGQRTDCMFTEIGPFVEGKAWVNHGEFYGFIDTNLNYVTDFAYPIVSSYHNGFAAFAIDSTYGFLNAIGSEICEPIYTRVKPYEYHFAPVMRDSLWGLLDSSGMEVFPCMYDFPPLILREHFIIICQRGMWGVVNEDRLVVHPLEYQYINHLGIGYRGGRQVELLSQ